MEDISLYHVRPQYHLPWFLPDPLSPGSDRSVRIWDTHTYAELAKLAHVQSVVSVAWMENDSGVVSLGELGEINRWTKLVRTPFSSEHCFGRLSMD